MTTPLSSILGFAAIFLGIFYAALPPRTESGDDTEPGDDANSDEPDSTPRGHLAGVPLREALDDPAGPGAVLRDRLTYGPPPDTY